MAAQNGHELSAQHDATECKVAVLRRANHREAVVVRAAQHIEDVADGRNVADRRDGDLHDITD
eukprot:3835755-Prymnesium_polylepis.1